MENQIKKRKCKQKEEDEHFHNTHGFNNLPNEITNDILSRLPITSLIQFGFVCRSWHTLAQDPDLVKLHFHQTGKNNPYLIFHSPTENQLHFTEFSGDQEDEGNMRKIETPFSTSMPKFNVIGSCNGLLWLSNSVFKDIICVYNPFTRNYKELPEYKRYRNQISLYGFGFHPTTNEYKVVKMVYYQANPSTEPWHRWESEVHVYSFSDETWRTVGSLQHQLEIIRSEAVSVSGRLHWVSQLGIYNGVLSRSIISFDLADEMFYEIPKPDIGDYQLSVLGECLSASVYQGNGNLEIWVMKKYGESSWIKEYDIASSYPSCFVSHDPQRCYGIWRRILIERVVRVLGLMKNGEILLEYKDGCLILYNPKVHKFRDFVFKGLPKLFRTIVHYGTLNWIDTPYRIEV